MHRCSLSAVFVSYIPWGLAALQENISDLFAAAQSVRGGIPEAWSTGGCGERVFWCKQHCGDCHDAAGSSYLIRRRCALTFYRQLERDRWAPWYLECYSNYIQKQATVRCCAKKCCCLYLNSFLLLPLQKEVEFCHHLLCIHVEIH